jgi:hypothetical protein
MELGREVRCPVKGRGLGVTLVTFMLRCGELKTLPHGNSCSQQRLEHATPNKDVMLALPEMVW